MFKGQVSNEFLFFISLLVLLLVLTFSVSSSTINRLNDVKTYEEAKKLCEDIASEINLALKAGDGYERKFFVKQDINGVVDFNIISENYALIISWGKNSVSSPIATKHVYGDIEKGWNLIKNVKGEIYVE